MIQEGSRDLKPSAHSPFCRNPSVFVMYRRVSNILLVEFPARPQATIRTCLTVVFLRATEWFTPAYGERESAPAPVRRLSAAQDVSGAGARVFLRAAISAGRQYIRLLVAGRRHLADGYRFSFLGGHSLFAEVFVGAVDRSRRLAVVKGKRLPSG
jgi:hypothetical protein